MVGFIESPNKWKGRRGYRPEAIVIHICDGSYEGCHAWLHNPKAQASAHYIVKKTGQYDQLVKFEDTAWHTGVVYKPTWPLLKRGINPNLYTLGIELGLKSGEFPTKEMLITVSRLVKHLSDKFEIPLDRNHVIGHREIRSNKTCPTDNVSVECIIYMAKIGF